MTRTKARVKKVFLYMLIVLIVLIPFSALFYVYRADFFTIQSGLSFTGSALIVLAFVLCTMKGALPKDMRWLFYPIFVMIFAVCISYISAHLVHISVCVLVSTYCSRPVVNRIRFINKLLNKYEDTQINELFERGTAIQETRKQGRV